MPFKSLLRNSTSGCQIACLFSLFVCSLDGSFVYTLFVFLSDSWALWFFKRSSRLQLLFSGPSLVGPRKKNLLFFEQQKLVAQHLGPVLLFLLQFITKDELNTVSQRASLTRDELLGSQSQLGVELRVFVSQRFRAQVGSKHCFGSSLVQEFYDWLPLDLIARFR